MMLFFKLKRPILLMRQAVANLCSVLTYSWLESIAFHTYISQVDLALKLFVKTWDTRG